MEVQKAAGWGVRDAELWDVLRIPGQRLALWVRKVRLSGRREPWSRARLRAQGHPVGLQKALLRAAAGAAGPGAQRGSVGRAAPGRRPLQPQHLRVEGRRGAGREPAENELERREHGRAPRRPRKRVFLGRASAKGKFC